MDQSEIAKEEMIRWLSHSGELGKAPYRIESTNKFDYLDMKYYIFKFKKSKFSFKWLLGVCGGFECDSIRDCGHTFSEFKRYYGQTEKEDAIKIIEIIRDFWKNKAQECDFLVKKGHNILTKDFLLSIKKNLRQQEIFFHICDYQLDGTRSELFEKTFAMKKGYQMIYIIWHLQGEINNGGYVQFFDNFENCNTIIKEYYDLIVDNLKIINYNEFLEDFSKARILYEKLRASSDKEEQDEYDKKLGELDNNFYEYESQLVNIVDDYVEAHIDDFVS